MLRSLLRAFFDDPFFLFFSLLIISAVFFPSRVLGRPDSDARPWEYQGPSNRESPYSTWYQAPKPGPVPYPNYDRGGYERPSSGYGPPPGYGPPSPRGVYNPEPITNNVMPQLPRKSNGVFYPPPPVGPDPNLELIAAIKDVVNKFRASLDQSGIEQDVRHMGTQLQHTWDQLRRGLHRSWDAVRQSAEVSVQPYGGAGPGDNLGRLLERAQIVFADALDAADDVIAANNTTTVATTTTTTSVP